MDEFHMVLANNGLFDVKPARDWFTWHYGGSANHAIKEHIDRFVASQSWRQAFPNGKVFTEFAETSNHCYLLMDTAWVQPLSRDRGDDYFCFEQCWASEEAFRILVKAAWDLPYSDILDKITEVGSKLSSWQKVRLAISRGRIQVLRNKINSSFSRHTSEAELQNLKRDKNELHLLLNKEEVYWMQSTVSDDSVIDTIDTVITDEMNGALCEDFTTDEIIAAFLDIYPQKAPGIDGLPTSFYRLHWDIVGADVVYLCLQLLQGTLDMSLVNKTVIVLIPKISDPQQMKHLRPISLCTVVYKIVSKVLVRWFKGHMASCIHETQAVFLPRRQISDNILVAHELIHYMNSSKMGLSALFNRLHAQKKIREMGASQNGPKEASIICDAFDSYEVASGQKVNLEKSILYFSPSTRQECRDQILSILGIGEVSDLGHYLGMPLHIGKNKTNTFGYLKEKVSNRIDRKTKHLLSFGGREVFLKAVAQALPQYIMYCYRLPDCLVQDLVSNMRHYWWSSDANRRGWPMVAWKTMCKPKRQGGMGFRDLQSINLALLGKQLWCFIKDPESLVARVHYDIWGGSKVVYLTGSYSNSDLNPLYCSDIMIDGSNVWNESLIYKLFSKEYAMQIFSVPIAPCAEDVIVWANHDSGIYSVRYGYWWLQKRNHDNERKSKLWSVMGKLKILPKIRVFAWRVARNALPVATGVAWLLVTNAKILHQDYLRAISVGMNKQRYTNTAIRWTPPFEGLIKVNVDGAFVAERRLSSIGVVAYFAELSSLLAGLRMACDMRWSDVQFETDSLMLVHKITQTSIDISTLDVYVQEARTIFQDHPRFCILHTPRECNQVAHALASWALNSGGFLVFESVCPDIIVQNVKNDVIDL
ncbi:uncharacterized protein LOC120185092 [Hibiscus syriacus]|uniref:uncharacterized protein LOC120185092 n=1 Tax=Hibiscus syriacus TaxID=106335 RepID=UPI0019221D73|nr:uncharacterized protein LOC120185092 [Hibiscus syriacus]